MSPFTPNPDVRNHMSKASALRLEDTQCISFIENWGRYQLLIPVSYISLKTRDANVGCLDGLSSSPFGVIAGKTRRILSLPFLVELL